jgi:hypothetical protein
VKSFLDHVLLSSQTSAMLVLPIGTHGMACDVPVPQPPPKLDGDVVWCGEAFVAPPLHRLIVSKL